MYGIKGVRINPTSLRVLMQQKGYTQAGFARDVGVSKDTVAAWLWGKYFPQRKNFDEICKVLDIAPNLLVASSAELVERGRTTRIVRFHLNELQGLNDDPEYREVSDITHDLALESERESTEEEVREEDFTISGEGESPEDPEPDADRSDEM